MARSASGWRRSIWAAAVDERAARQWCEALAPRCQVDHIEREGRPYLDRFYVAGWYPGTGQKGVAVFLHHFRASDPTTVHSHPWRWALSLILAGGYREHRCAGGGLMQVRDYPPGTINVLEADDRHRIELLADDCWTLFLAGDYAKPWRFDPEC
jgi:hypothetical protein